MVGIGHLLAEGEMQKEARGGTAAAALGLAGVGIAAGSAVGGYGGHLYGQSKAHQDHAAGTPGVNKPGVGAFIMTPAGVIMGRRAYDRQLAELQAEKQAAAIPNGIREAVSQRTKAILIGGGATLATAGALGGAGYWAHRRQKRDGQQPPSW